jgi:glycine oxidase
MEQVPPQFDAAIIGGGVIGCAIAWRLGQAGLRTVVIERGELGREASWAAGGMLAPLAEADYADAFFDLAVASRAMYADFAAELRSLTEIDIEYRTEGTLYLAFTDEDEDELEHRWQWQRATGLQIKKLDAAGVQKLEPILHPALRWALKFPDDHQVDNRRLMTALVAAARKAGVAFWTQTEATEILIANSQVAGLATARGEIKTKTVILAAGCWSGLLRTNDERAMKDFFVAPVRGQMVALEMPMPALRHVVYSRNAYLVPRLSGHIIAGSTTEQVGYDKQTTASGIASIIERAVAIAPALAKQAVQETWAGLRPKTKDDWPILGVDPQISGLIYATGHYRNGILLTPITAQAVSDLVTSGDSPVNISPFSLARFTYDLRRSA